MKLGEIYKTVVDFGIKMDPRGKDKIKKELLRAKTEYDRLNARDKDFYDRERLVHPYADTRILFGDKDTEVKTIIVGIDMEVGEVLLADRLRDKGEKVDLIFAHHPEGTALAGFFNVMYMQVDILNKFGVPINIAEALMAERVKEVERRVMPANHMRSVDASRLLNIPFMNCHTPADNCVVSFLQNLLDKEKPETLGDVIDILKNIPEYKKSSLQNTPPKVVKGGLSNKAGKIFVDMTGGTEGSKNIFSKLANAGVSTLVCMHLSEEHLKKAGEEHLNVIIAGHIASDNIGLNIIFDELQRKDNNIKILECSGFRRFSRRANKKR